MPRRQPVNRLGDYSPQWLTPLIEMRLITAKKAIDAHKRAIPAAAPPSSKPRRRKPE